MKPHLAGKNSEITTSGEQTRLNQKSSDSYLSRGWSMAGVDGHAGAASLSKHQGTLSSPKTRR